jgi:bacterioferritin-associated ferredoxin
VYACICLAVTTNEVSAAIDDGADTVEAVSDTTGACTGCGTCYERIETMLGSRAQQHPARTLFAAA